MDHNVIAVERYIAWQEDANAAGCWEAAKAHGLTPEQAEACDAGEHDCPTCPWGGKDLRVHGE